MKKKKKKQKWRTRNTGQWSQAAEEKKEADEDREWLIQKEIFGCTFFFSFSFPEIPLNWIFVAFIFSNSGPCFTIDFFKFIGGLKQWLNSLKVRAGPVCTLTLGYRITLIPTYVKLLTNFFFLSSIPREPPEAISFLFVSFFYQFSSTFFVQDLSLEFPLNHLTRQSIASTWHFVDLFKCLNFAPIVETIKVLQCAPLKVGLH